MPPYLLLSVLLGAVYGTLFHLWRGKTFQDLLIFFVAGVLGFLLGQALGNLLGLEFFLIGPLHMGEATTGSLVSLLVVQWIKL
jgi:uncharacterized membrane protein YjjP (DUF1212 family)